LRKTLHDSIAGSQHSRAYKLTKAHVSTPIAVAEISSARRTPGHF